MKRKNIDTVVTPEYFVEKATKDFQEQLQLYKNKLTSLVDNNLDYAFLRELIKDCNPDVEIIITLKDGTKLNIRKATENKYQRPTL